MEHRCNNTKTRWSLPYFTICQFLSSFAARAGPSCMEAVGLHLSQQFEVVRMFVFMNFIDQKVGHLVSGQFNVNCSMYDVNHGSVPDNNNDKQTHHQLKQRGGHACPKEDETQKTKERTSI